jgi:hypothetical protein
MLVVSDTSDRAHLGQTPSLARRFVAVSVATITSFSGLLIEIDIRKICRLPKLGPIEMDQSLLHIENLTLICSPRTVCVPSFFGPWGPSGKPVVGSSSESLPKGAHEAAAFSAQLLSPSQEGSL